MKNFSFELPRVNLKLFVTISCLGLSHCGSKSPSSTDTNNGVDSKTLASDESLSAATVNANYSDLMSAASDQTSSGAALTMLNSSTTKSDKSSLTQTCAVSGSTAVVTVNGTINKVTSATGSGGKVTVERTVTGSNEQKRTWSRTSGGSSVECGSSGKHAKVNWLEPSGLKLELTFSRSREASYTRTGPRSTITSSQSFKASGSRTVSWSDNSTSTDTSTTYVRNKSVESSVVREASLQNKSGAKKDVKLTIKTKDGAPLVVAVERLKTDNTPQSRTIKSGTLVATKDADDGRIETSFSNMKVSLTTGECVLTSGSATSVFYDKEGTKLKSYTLSVDSNGDPKLADTDSGQAVEDFELDACDPEDLKL